MAQRTVDRLWQRLVFPAVPSLWTRLDFFVACWLSILDPGLCLGNSSLSRFHELFAGASKCKISRNLPIERPFGLFMNCDLFATHLTDSILPKHLRLYDTLKPILLYCCSVPLQMASNFALNLIFTMSLTCLPFTDLCLALSFVTLSHCFSVSFYWLCYFDATWRHFLPTDFLSLTFISPEEWLLWDHLSELWPCPESHARSLTHLNENRLSSGQFYIPILEYSKFLFFPKNVRFIWIWDEFWDRYFWFE